MDGKEYLEHYGILGMHWGHKKGSSVSDHATVVRTRNSEDHDKKVALKGKRLSEMSNDEIRLYTQRAILEKQYKELSKADISTGRKLVNSIVNKATKAATDAALNYVTQEANKRVEDILKKTAKALK